MPSLAATAPAGPTPGSSAPRTEATPFQPVHGFLLTHSVQTRERLAPQLSAGFLPRPALDIVPYLREFSLWIPLDRVPRTFGQLKQAMGKPDERVPLVSPVQVDDACLRGQSSGGKRGRVTAGLASCA